MNRFADTFLAFGTPSLQAGISQFSRITTVKRPSHRLVTPVELFNGFCRGHSGLTLKRVVIWVRCRLTRSRPAMPCIRAALLANLRTWSVPTGASRPTTWVQPVARVWRESQKQASARMKNPEGRACLAAVPSGRPNWPASKFSTFPDSRSGLNALTIDYVMEASTPILSFFKEARAVRDRDEPQGACGSIAFPEEPTD